MDRAVIDRKLESLRRAVGFRNIAVHNYDAIDWQIVMALSGAPLQDFENFAKAIATYTAAHG